MCQQLLALMRKNFILMRRNKCCCCCELFVPIVMTMLLVLLRRRVDIESIAAESFATVPKPLFLNDSENSNGLPFMKLRDCQDYRNQSVIGLAPPSSPIIKQLGEYLSAMDPTTKILMFDNNSQIDDYVRSDDYSDGQPELCLAVALTSESKSYNYSIRYEMYGNPQRLGLPSTEHPERDPTMMSNLDILDQWTKTGFLSLQTLLDTLIIRANGGGADFKIMPAIESIFVAEHVEDTFANYTKGSFGLFFVLPLLVVYLRLTYQLLYEKEKKLREGMLMMGLRTRNYYASWILTYMIYFAVLSILNMSLAHFAVFKVPTTTIHQNINWVILFLLYYGLCLVLIAQAIFISVFFSNSLIGLVVAIVFFLLQYMFILMTSATDSESSSTSSSAVLTLASLSTHAAVQLAFDLLIAFQVQKHDFSFGNLRDSVENYNMTMALATTYLFNIWFYLLLGLYLDQVFPNEWGQRKHPLFCCIRRKPTQGPAHNNSNGPLSAFESVTRALKDQAASHETLSVLNLVKTYDNGKKAVHGISLDLYKGQIFVLLGHNGAGKTTTISMLTGLLEATSGSFSAFGHENMDMIRTFMGVCPQYNTLFDTLTVKEHLEMFARFKGMNENTIETASKAMIVQLDLEEKTDYLSKDLSGGQKRRLLVGMAFIGDSKLVFLDEPTSGMDTSARRYVWTLLKNLKQDRIIILTTHFMDEADYLGDRIGIMSAGKLVCCGSPGWLKNRYGEGYTLTIIKANSTTPSQPIIDLVEKALPEAKILSNVSAELQFQLPMDRVAVFPQLFMQIEKFGSAIRDFAVSITTLEEVFLKVAKLTGEANHAPPPASVDLNNTSFSVPANQPNMMIPHTKALIKKRLNYMKRDRKSIFCELVLPCLTVTGGLAMMSVSSIHDTPSLELGPSLFDQDLEYLYTSPAPMPWINSTWRYQASTMPLNVSLNKTDMFYASNLSENGIGWYAIQSRSSYALYADTKYKDSPPVLLNQLNRQILDSYSDASITVTLDPLPMTAEQRDLRRSVSGIGALFTFSLGLSFIPASIISFVVKEKQVAMKHQQLVSGVSLSAYWMSHFLTDFTRNLIPSLWSIAMIQAFGVSSMIDGGAYGAACAIFFLFGWSIGPFCYLFSFLFNFEGNAMLVTFFVNVVLGTIIPMVMYILRIIPSTRSIAQVLMWIMRIFPSYSFGYGLLNVTSTKIIAKIEGVDSLEPSDIRASGGDMLMLGLMGIVYTILVFVCEYIFNIKKIGSAGLNVAAQATQIGDPDVRDEVKMVGSLSSNEYPVVVKQLRQVYSTGKVAVADLSFKVPVGEVFGLLGVNGAGKSTTFKILSGEIKPSSGECWVSGYSLTTQLAEARKHIGYCPQFDALLDKLTVREHLELYCVIKGIQTNMQDQLITRTIQQMDLERFTNVCSGELSGGNKRKLSVGIAMIGNPPVILLDEPSSGMDPEARRFMWDVISAVATKRQEASIILTTHSMEEAEALSSRLAIMVEGRFQCLGSIPAIKSKYGGGYEIEVKLSIKDSDIDSFLTQMGSGTYVQESEMHQVLGLHYSALSQEVNSTGRGQAIWMELQKHHHVKAVQLAEWIAQETYGTMMLEFMQQQLHTQLAVIEHFSAFYRLKCDQVVPLSRLFSIMENNKAQMRISHYSIKQTSLEQIFNQFATGTQQLRQQPTMNIPQRPPYLQQHMASVPANQAIPIENAADSPEASLSPTRTLYVSRKNPQPYLPLQEEFIEMQQYNVYT